MDEYPRASARATEAGGRLDVAERTGSTNADLLAASGSGGERLPHLTVRVTADQTAGRGRLDRTWTAPAGTALAISALVRVDAVPPASRGWIPLVAGAAMTRAIAAQLAGRGHSVRVKWPNDVLVDGLKICGILAEAVPGDPDAVVIGAGVNTRMPREALPVPTAVSFAALGAEADDDRLLADYLDELDAQLRALGQAHGDASGAGIRAELEALTATVGSDVRVSLPDGSTLLGHAQRLDAEGRLVVVVGDREVAVSAGDVVHVR